MDLRVHLWLVLAVSQREVPLSILKGHFLLCLAVRVHEELVRLLVDPAEPALPLALTPLLLQIASRLSVERGQQGKAGEDSAGNFCLGEACVLQRVVVKTEGFETLQEEELVHDVPCEGELIVTERENLEIWQQLHPLNELDLVVRTI